MAKQRYGLLERTTGEIKEFREFDDPKRSLNKKTVWLSVNDPGRPAHDPKSQRVTWVYDIPDLSNLARPVPAGTRIKVVYTLANIPAVEQQEAAVRDVWSTRDDRLSVDWPPYRVVRAIVLEDTVELQALKDAMSVIDAANPLP